MKRALSVAFVLLASIGCQGTLPGMNGLGQPGRVPPPATGSYAIPGSYSGSTGLPASGTGTASASSPWVDQVAAAQNQLKQATDNARSAVFQSTQTIQSQVEQAASRADRLGSGVVQASQILTDAAQAPPASGTLSDSIPSNPATPTTPPTTIDPSAQWRTPQPR